MARKVDPKPNSSTKNFSLISDAKLKQLYAAMLKCRMLDETLRQLPTRDKPKHLSSKGHEAALVGAAIDLRREDWILPQLRQAIAAVLRGESLPAIASRSRTILPEPLKPGAEPLSPIPPLGNIVPPVGSLAAQLNIAIGLSLAAQSREKGQVVMALCESDAAASPQIAEALRFAALRQLPLLILALASKTRPSSASTSKTQPATVVTESRASGIPVIPVDHADIVAMYRVAFESIHKARHNGGPTLIEATIWPLPANPHQANSPDPIARMEEYLAAKGLFSDRWKQSLAERFQAEAALLQPPPSPK